MLVQWDVQAAIVVPPPAGAGNSTVLAVLTALRCLAVLVARHGTRECAARVR